MKPLNVLSLFDGMSCGQIALNRAAIPIKNYFASENDKFAIKVTQANYPGTEQIGIVENVNAEMFKDVKIDLLIGGSPCQGFSYAGKKLNFNDPRSKLFFEYVRILKELIILNPDLKFLFENVPSNKQTIKIISDFLGVQPVVLNSNLVSAQNRVRYYWTNLRTVKKELFGFPYSDIPEPEDKKIFLKDIIQNNDEVDKKYILSDKYMKYLYEWTYSQKLKGNNFGACFRGRNDKSTTLLTSSDKGSSTFLKLDVNHKQRLNPNKASCLSGGANSGGNHSDMDILLFYNFQDPGTSVYRRLTPIECERLQTVPDNYTNHVSDSQRYKILGNGWTVDMIVHILSFFL